MYNKTTGPYFLKYGNIVNKNDYENNPDYDTDYLEANIKTINDVFRYDTDLIIRCADGIAMLCVCEDPSFDNVHEFVLHRTVALKPNLYFNIIPMTDKATIQLYFKRGISVSNYKLAESFSLQDIKASFLVDKIYSYYYSAKGPGYKFDGEEHNFFELTYVDNGSLHVTVDDKPYDIGEYEVMIFGPHQFHTQEVITSKPATYLTVMFSCDIDDPSFLLNRVFKVKRDMLSILDKFVNEANVDLPYKEDLAITYFKLLIVQMLQYDAVDEVAKPASPIRQHFENEMLNEILNYIEANICEPLTIDEICMHFSISRSSLQNLFKDNMDIAPKQYINEAKLKKATIMIQESKHNMSEIALMLGFNSIHYFSRKFTQRYNITPTDYAKSIYKNK